MKHPASQHLFNHWDAVRAGRAAPDRSDIDPAAIRNILADTLMIDVITQRNEVPTFTVRLAGTRVNALFGRDLKSESFTALWRASDQDEVASLATAVLDETRPAVVGVEASPEDAPVLAMEMLLVPLRHMGRTHARLLGTLSPAIAPDWLGVRAVSSLTLGPFRMIESRPKFGAGPTIDFARPRPFGRRCGPFMIYEGGRA